MLLGGSTAFRWYAALVASAFARLHVTWPASRRLLRVTVDQGPEMPAVPRLSARAYVAVHHCLPGASRSVLVARIARGCGSDSPHRDLTHDRAQWRSDARGAPIRRAPAPPSGKKDCAVILRARRQFGG